jgi:hypothetical protein
MPRLPKIALARLKQKPDAPKATGASAGLAGFQGGQHPDANLLAAFVEKTLTERERTEVLNHLSQCAECREVAAFTLPAEEAEVEPTHVAVPRRWNPWPVFRWIALAAVLGTLTLVVVLHPGMRKGRQEISRLTPPSVPAGSISSAPSPAPVPPLAQSPPPSVRPNVHAAEKKTAGDLAATSTSFRPPEDLTQDNLKARAQADRQMSSMAFSRPSVTAKGTSIPPASAERERLQGENVTTAQALPVPALPSAAAGEPMAASGQAGKAETGSKALEKPLATGASRATVLGMKASASTAVAAPAKAAPRVTAQSTLHMTAQAGIGGFRASHKEIGSGAVPPAALWNVSSDGKVQRATDAGKAWQQIQVADGIKFLAIAALGNNIWTGGSDGALFHSADGGATWARADITFEGIVVTETITGIQSSDPQHLTVTTASGAQWSSEDSGQTWQKKP